MLVSKNLILFGAISYTIALIIVSLIDVNQMPSLGSSYDDKLYHFIAYFGFAFLWNTYTKGIKISKYLRVFVSLICFGIILELIQHNINPNRMYELYDLLANCLGVIIGTLVALRLHKIKLK